MPESKQLFSSVEIKNLQTMTVAYVRHVGPYAGDSELFSRLYRQLFGWAGPRGLLNFPQTLSLCIYHDDPATTAPAALRTDVAITVPPDTRVEDGIGKAEIPAGKYAAAHFEINPEQYGEAWQAVSAWLPQSGYQPDARPCFELMLNDPQQHPQKKHIVDIYIPIKA